MMITRESLKFNKCRGGVEDCVITVRNASADSSWFWNVVFEWGLLLFVDLCTKSADPRAPKLLNIAIGSSSRRDGDRKTQAQINNEYNLTSYCM